MSQRSPRGLLRFFIQGGWVILLALAVFVGVTAWALAPALLRMNVRPPGDGENVASYQFDLSNLRLPATAVLEPAMLYRDMVPVLDEPAAVVSIADVRRIAMTRKKFLLPDDAVIGVTVEGESRAYPVSMLHVHELVHDNLGGVPILVSWHWPSASPRVFDRRIDGAERTFGVSGLVAGGNQTIYPRRLDGGTGDEPLYSQLLGRSITGPPSALRPIPSTFTTWDRWTEAQPDTSAAGRVEGMTKRYKHADPSAYYLSSGRLFQSAVPEGGPSPKDPVLLLPDGTLYTGGPDVEHVRAAQGNPPRLEPRPLNQDADYRHALWHAAHALGLGGAAP
ncbi:MAG: DUF3179 domain-containing (seleno)protein [Phycisphaerales bacterium]|jgi:hypothetical protein|nr:DUF3179 domain-containing (seleno)protein [Phycisphaerales bacterium]